MIGNMISARLLSDCVLEYLTLDTERSGFPISSLRSAAFECSRSRSIFLGNFSTLGYIIQSILATRVLGPIIEALKSDQNQNLSCD